MHLFGGKGNWIAFFNKFPCYAEIAEWTEEQKRQYLCWWLDDAASEYYTLLLENNKTAIRTRDSVFKNYQKPNKFSFIQVLKAKGRLGGVVGNSVVPLEHIADTKSN